MLREFMAQGPMLDGEEAGLLVLMLAFGTAVEVLIRRKFRKSWYGVAPVLAFAVGGYLINFDRIEHGFGMPVGLPWLALPFVAAAATTAWVSRGLSAHWRALAVIGGVTGSFASLLLAVSLLSQLPPWLPPYTFSVCWPFSNEDCHVVHCYARFK